MTNETLQEGDAAQIKRWHGTCEDVLNLRILEATKELFHKRWPCLIKVGLRHLLLQLFEQEQKQEENLTSEQARKENKTVRLQR